MNETPDPQIDRRSCPALLTLGAVLVVVTLAGAMLWMRNDGGSDDRGDSVELRVGDAAPSFSLPGAGGSVYTLDELVVEKSVLLYFSMGPG